MIKKEEKKNKKVAEGTSRHKRRKAAKISVFAVLVIIALFLVLVGGYSIAYSSKVYANVTLGDANLGGKNKAEVENYIKQKSEDFLKSPFRLRYQPDGEAASHYEINPSEIGLVFDTEKTINRAFGYGRDGSIVNNFVQQLLSLIKPYRIEAAYAINQEALDKKLQVIAESTDIPEKDYEITYAGEGQYKLKSEKQTGKRIPQEKIRASVVNQISEIKMREYAFSTELYEPKVTSENAEAKLRAANKILAAGELKLAYSELTYSFDVDTIGGIIKSRPKEGDLELYMDQTKAAKQIENIAQVLNRAPKNAILQASGTGITAFQLSEDGRELDREKTLIDVGNALLARATDGVTDINTRSVNLSVKVTEPEISSSSLDSYGLKELVATATTDFRKSPANRVHNITVGTNAISGTLLKPGEEFSTLAKLGEIDASAGYLPELVIKENRTIPEYGGGLCQVSTTLFRTAMNAGMQITARSNHKYRVSYYEPPVGMDATIYDPAPDFKFINNYSSHILIQGKVVGTKVLFEFYGTKDSRVVEVGTPDLYDIVEPGPAIEIPSDTLPAGQRQQLEKAHAGASTKFHYKVTRDGTTLQERDFLSKYVAWPEKWLVGIAPVTPPAAPAEAPPIS